MRCTANCDTKVGEREVGEREVGERKTDGYRLLLSAMMTDYLHTVRPPPETNFSVLKQYHLQDHISFFFLCLFIPHSLLSRIRATYFLSSHS